MFDALGLAMQKYLLGLRYTLLLNALGFHYLYKAWSQDLYVLRDTIVVPRWFLFLVGSALHIPGLLYLYVGCLSASRMVR